MAQKIISNLSSLRILRSVWTAWRTALKIRQSSKASLSAEQRERVTVDGLGNIAMAKEKMHKENRTYLTIPEKRYIVKLAKDNYADKDWKKGGTRCGRPLRLR